MIYSYSQISQFLSCPRRYRYRYADGCREKDSHPNMLFGRAFEKALLAYFQRQDSPEVLFREWSPWKDAPPRIGSCRGTTRRSRSSRFCN
jgi:PD-(D/E)XK nuclease superfamily